MFSTGLLTVLAATCGFLALVLSVLCWVNARSARLYAQNCEVWVNKVAQMRDPSAKVAELSAEMTELTDSYHALMKSHKKLRARIGMRENRTKTAGQDGDLSNETDKARLRLAAKSAGYLK